MYIMKETHIQEFLDHLRQEERSQATIEKYARTLRCLYHDLPEGKQISKEQIIAYKAVLGEQYAPASVNAALAAINGFLKFQGLHDCCVKPLRIQRRVFCSKEKELTKRDYEKLVSTAERSGDRRLALLLQLMGSTGIRVSEIQYVTVESVSNGVVEISLKGKSRVILLPGKLCRKLEKYIRANGIRTGAVFRSRSGRPLGRKAIWYMMKRICKKAGVPPEKVFPHNLRHLFARIFYQAQKDIAKLADLLGHSSVETTRIYLLSSGAEHRRAIEQLRLID